jgi:hypothetical protein
VTEEVTELTNTGAVEEPAGYAGSSATSTAVDGTDAAAAANDTASSGELRDGAGNTENAADPHRLLERGVALHGVSADEDEDEDTDDDSRREMTEEEEATAKAMLDDPSYDQEGLTLTGGDWFVQSKSSP